MAATDQALTAGMPAPETTDTVSAPGTPSESKSQPRLSRRSRRHRDCLRAVGFFLVMSLTLSTGIAVLVHHWLTPVTVSFDLTRTVDQFRDQMAQQISPETPLSEAQIAGTSRRFQDAMSESLTEYSRDRHAVILVTPAVAAGVPDITAEIQASIAEKMSGGE